MISPNLSSTAPFPLRPAAETSPPPASQPSNGSPPSSPTSNGETASVSRMTNFSIAAIMNSSGAAGARPPVSVASLFANPLTASPMAAMTAAQRYQTALLTMQQNQAAAAAAAAAAVAAAGLRRPPQDPISSAPAPPDALVNSSPYGKQ